MLLRHRKLKREIDLAEVRHAIEAAERASSGQIRVSIAPFFLGNVRRAAEVAFTRLQMTATRRRNGILFFVVPGRRQFTVLGDSGIHEHVGDQFWEDVSAAVSERFRAGDFTGGLVHGIETVGRELAEHFPPDGPDVAPELSPEVDLGKKR
jgi:uncharacterized membrane protein